MQFLYFLQQALVWLITIYWIYQLVISLFALVKIKDKPYIVELAREFAGSGIHAFVTVGSVEKSVINQLAESLNF